MKTLPQNLPSPAWPAALTAASTPAVQGLPAGRGEKEKTMDNTLLTTKLRSGQVVLAKMYKGEPSAMTFTNRTQAEVAAARARAVGAWLSGIRPVFVVVGGAR